MKRLTFAPPLPQLIQAGTKTVTWRINDEKNIIIEDQLSLCDDTGREFAQAVATNVREITFGQLTDEDKLGHEGFNSDEEMYATYSRYYQMTVTPETKVKIIRFKLLETP